MGINGVCYRRLDPEYYAWLRHKMALEAGRLDSAAFDGLRTRFNDIHAWAVARFGENELLAAVRRLDPKTYPPPAIDQAAQSRPACAAPVSPVACPLGPAVEPYLYPKDGGWRITEKVPQSAIDKVDAIRDQALSLGWSEARLYQNRGRFRFPCGEDFGLVCFVDANERIGEEPLRLRDTRGRAWDFQGRPLHHVMIYEVKKSGSKPRNLVIVRQGDEILVNTASGLPERRALW